jgi:hypothetical protein
MKRTTGFEAMGDRYKYDFNQCHFKKGWAQLDTRQDASYFGNWLNPITFEHFSYCEGDLTHIQCESAEEFKNWVIETVNWHKERGYFIGIDGMCDEKIISAFKALGLEEFLH